MSGAAAQSIAAAAGLSAVTIGLVVDGGDPASFLRHAYFLPVVLAALAFGLVGAMLAGSGVLLLFAPIVLPDVERHGLTTETAEALVTIVLVLALGVIVGAQRTQTRRQAQRLALVIAVQELLAHDDPIEILLRRLRALLIARLPVHDVAILVDGGPVASGDGETALAASLVLAVMRTGRAAFIADTGQGPRPRRVGAVPLEGLGGRIGVLVVEAHELSPADRTGLAALGAYVGLGLENARLAVRQRRAADELDAKVAEATRHLEETARAKSTFVAIASHELRTPLTALLGFGELLATRAYPVVETQRLAAIIHRETHRLVRLVDDLLDLSRLERGATPALRRAPLSPGRALSGVSELFRHVGGRLVVRCGPGLPEMDADADAVDRILKNLVTNALKYSPETRTVEVEAGSDGAGSVRFSVRDRGAGIPADALPHVFEPYYRAPGAAVAATGMGLGLAVVKALVEAHGGVISVESAPGRGTEVSFTVPAATARTVAMSS